MTEHVPDLDRYLDRIGHRGPLAVTRACLDALMAAHTRAIPFENLDVILGRPVDVTLPAVEAKLLTRRHADGRKESRTLASAAEVVAVLAEEFGLRLPPGAELPG